MFALLAWTIVPNIAEGLHIDRVYSIFLVAFSAFVALSVIRLARIPKAGRILPMLMVSIILLESVGYPIYYHAGSSLPAAEHLTAIQYYTRPDFEFADWMRAKTDSNAFLISDLKGYYLCTGLMGYESEKPAVPRSVDPISFFIEQKQANYFVGVTYVRGYAVVYDEETLGQRVVFLGTNVTRLSNAIGFTRLFDNGRDYLLGYPPIGNAT
jgi:hypothetical protein